MARKRILAIDGGGIRGILPLCALVELERQLGQPAREFFSFMAGTSTGSIISGGLSLGLSAARCLEIYRELGARVFEFDLPGFVGTLGSYKYQSEPLAKLLREFLGDPTLNELKTDIMLTAMRVRDGRPFYFVNDNALTLALPDRINTGALRLVDCITASSAAPTFFEPWMVPGVGVCVDGGVGIAGNPSYQACVEAFEYTPAGTYRPSETTVVSLGTGYFKHEFDPGNLLAWVKWIVDQLLEEPIDQQTELIRRHYVPKGVHLVRLDVDMGENIPMDQAAAIPRLVEIGMAAAQKLDWLALLTAPDGSREVAPAGPLPRNRA